MNTFKRLVSIILLSALFSCAWATHSNNEFKPQQHDATHYISIENAKGQGGYCSATAISPHVLLTAVHCDIKDGMLTVDDENTVQPVAERVYDGHEHMLLVVPGENFKAYVDYPAIYKPLVQGEHVYFWGNPAGTRDMYREGVVMGMATADFKGLTKIEGKAYYIQIIDAPGDSGAAIFAEDGRLVAVLTGGTGVVTVAYPLAFTPGQIAQAEHVK